MLFDSYLEPVIDHMRKNYKEILGTMNNNLTQSLTRLINCFFNNYIESEVKRVSKEELDNLESQIDEIFIFCLIWSICCTVDHEGREKFNAYLRDYIKQKNPKVQIPSAGTIYDYLFNEKTK